MKNIAKPSKKSTSEKENVKPCWDSNILDPDRFKMDQTEMVYTFNICLFKLDRLGKRFRWFLKIKKRQRRIG